MDATAVPTRESLSWQMIGALLLGVLLARWTWILFAPHALVSLPPKSEINAAISASLFGTLSASGELAAADAGALSNVNLIGVYSGKQGFAVLRLDDGKRQFGVALGEFFQGARLVEVSSDHVLLEHDGVHQRVNLNNDFAIHKESGASSATPDAEKAAADWIRVNQEMQKGRGPNARQ